MATRFGWVRCSEVETMRERCALIAIKAAEGCDQHCCQPLAEEIARLIREVEVEVQK